MSNSLNRDLNEGDFLVSSLREDKLEDQANISINARPGKTIQITAYREMKRVVLAVDPEEARKLAEMLLEAADFVDPDGSESAWGTDDTPMVIPCEWEPPAADDSGLIRVVQFVNPPPAKIKFTPQVNPFGE